MSENDEKFKSCDCGEQSWIKFGLILLAAFIGFYLAAYYVFDRMSRSYYIPVRPIHNIDNVLREQDKFFNELEAAPFGMRTALPVNSSVVQALKNDDAYKIIIDLKPFGGDPANIKTQIMPHKINIKGEKFVDRNGTESDYSFSQSLNLPEKIEVKNVTKEKVKDKYIITLPFKD